MLNRRDMEYWDNINKNTDEVKILGEKYESQNKLKKYAECLKSSAIVQVVLKIFR